MKSKIEKVTASEKEGKTMQKNIVKVLSPKSGGRNLNSVKSEKDLAKFSEKNPIEKEGQRTKDRDMEKAEDKKTERVSQKALGIGKSFGNLIDRKNDEGIAEYNEKEKQLTGKIRKDKVKEKNIKKEEKQSISTSDIGADLEKTKFFRKNTQPETSPNYNYNYNYSHNINNNNFNLNISEKKERQIKKEEEKEEDKTKKMQMHSFDKDAKIKQLIQKCQTMGKQCQKLSEDKGSMKFVIDQLQADKAGLQSKLDKLRNVAAENRKLLKEKAEGFTSSSYQIKVLRSQLAQIKNTPKTQIEKMQTGINTDLNEKAKSDRQLNKKQMREFGVNTMEEQPKYGVLNESVNLEDFLKSNIASDTHEDYSKLQQKSQQKSGQFLQEDSVCIEVQKHDGLQKQRDGQEITTLLKKIIEEQNQKLKDREETIYELEKELNQLYEKLQNAGTISALSQKRNSQCSDSRSNSSLQNISVEQSHSKTNAVQINSSFSLNVNLDTEKAVLLQIKQNQNLKTLINDQERKFYELKKQLWMKDRDIANLQQQIRLKEIITQAENDRSTRLEQSRKKFSQKSVFQNEIQLLRQKLRQSESRGQDLEQKNSQQQLLIKALKQKKTIIFK